MSPTQIDDTQLRELIAQGKTQVEIAQMLGTSRHIVRRRIEKLGPLTSSETSPDMSTSGTPMVYNPLPESMLADLEKIIVWWHEREAHLKKALDPSRETRRITYFIEKRWEEAILRQCDIDGLTQTQLMNEALRRYFERE